MHTWGSAWLGMAFASATSLAIVACEDDLMSVGDLPGLDASFPSLDASLAPSEAGPGSALYSVTASVVGLAGTGLVLRTGAGQDLVVEPGPDGGTRTVRVATDVPSGTAYDVAVKTQPSSPSQVCVVTGGRGTVTDGDVDSITCTCTTDTYKISLDVTGLAGSGLVFQNNLSDDLPVTAAGKVSFASAVASGSGYSITQLSPPTNPWQTCVVENAVGTIAAADVTLSATCTTNTYKIKGSLSGLQGSGLVLHNTSGPDLTLDASDNGTFTFATPVASTGTYSVSVKTQPSGTPGETCQVVSPTGAGTVTNADITSIQVVCNQPKYVFVSSQTYTGDLGGLAGADQKCQTLAKAAKLPGTYKAWLSDSTMSASSRLSHSTLPYRLVDGTIVANHWSDLTDGTLAHAIDKTEANGPTPLGTTTCGGGGFLTAWTNTTPAGTLSYSAYSCSNWSSSAATGALGRVDQVTTQWTAWCTNAACTAESPIYCLEQ